MLLYILTMLNCHSAAKDVAERSGDINSVPAEPEIHEESLMNSTSGL
jgi:hypothetical protein